MIRALVFDFDGLILDTEMPEFQAWQEVYEAHGCSLLPSDWVDCIGTTASVSGFDPCVRLEAQLGRPVEREVLRAQCRQRNTELVESQEILPGILGYLQEAAERGLRVGLASSSSHRWVDGHLARLGLTAYFRCVKCRDDVEHPKPDPALYRAVLDEFGLRPDEAIALEDSANGVLAAKRAGLFCVAVPNTLTRTVPLDHADLVVDSLADLPLERLLSLVEGEGMPHRACVARQSRLAGGQGKGADSAD